MLPGAGGASADKRCTNFTLCGADLARKKEVYVTKKRGTRLVVAVSIGGLVAPA